ncbi:MAG: hypothetical protein RI897_2919 [Verrucomicrobiota bacterium]|jgi:hypothetical protein
MKRTLQIIALALAISTTLYWAASGANRGWTKNSDPITKTDDITGIEYTEYADRFVPGLDFLGVSLACSSLLAGASLLFKNQKLN